MRREITVGGGHERRRGIRMQVGLDVLPGCQDLVLGDLQGVSDLAEVALGERLEVIGDQRLGNAGNVVTGFAQVAQLHEQ